MPLSPCAAVSSVANSKTTGSRAGQEAHFKVGHPSSQCHASLEQGCYNPIQTWDGFPERADSATDVAIGQCAPQGIELRKDATAARLKTRLNRVKLGPVGLDSDTTYEIAPLRAGIADLSGVSLRRRAHLHDPVASVRIGTCFHQLVRKDGCDVVSRPVVPDPGKVRRIIIDIAEVVIVPNDGGIRSDNL